MPPEVDSARSVLHYTPKNLEAIAIRLEAIAIRLEANAIRNKENINRRKVYIYIYK